MGQQMTNRQRRMVTLTIQNANPCPKDIDDCMDLLEKKEIFTMEKAEIFWDEICQVCQQAMHAMDTRPPTPPRSAISPPSSADPVPATLHVDAALLDAARGSRDTASDAVFLAISDKFEYANAKFTDAEFSYIREKTVKKAGLQCRNGIVQVGWKDSNPDPDNDNTARATVFVFVSEEEASRVEMNVDVLFGKHCKKEPDIQLHAVRASMDNQSATLPFEVQPDDSCAGSVAEAASPPSQALQSVPSQFNYALVVIGPDAGRQAANFVATLQHEAARQSEALGR